MIDLIRYCVKRRLKKRPLYHVVVMGLVAFLFVAVAHDIIPGLHIENEFGAEIVCPFCKLIYSPALPVLALLVLFLALNESPLVWAAPKQRRTLFDHPLSCRAPPMLPA